MIFHIRLNTDRFNRFIASAREALDLSRPGPIQDGALAASDQYMQAMRDRFVREGDGDWAELKPKTIEERERLGYGDHPTLYREGAIARSLERGSPDHVLEVLSDKIQEGTANVIARIQHDGAPSKNLPSRTILVPPSPDVIDSMRTELAVGVSVGLKNAATGT